MTIFYRGRHARPRSLAITAIITMLAVVAATMTMTLSGSTPAYASTAGGALNWAEYNAAGHWYCWGGTGPACYDCSGLVYEAYLHKGIALPRTTYGMLGSWHLVRTYSPQRGDLAFFGSGHVEFVTAWYHTTFGAHHSGTRIGWARYYPPSWAPTAFYRVR